MKRKMFTVLLMILIVVLAGSTLILAACNNGEDDKRPPASNNKNTAAMLSEIIDNFKETYKLGEQFGVDISAAFVVDDKTEANKDVTYKLVVKGNADFSETAESDAVNLVAEITETKGESVRTVFGIAYEVIDNEPFFFINLMDGGYAKINGYSLAALYAQLTADDESEDKQAEGSLDIVALIKYIAPVFFGETGTVKDGVYTFNFNLFNMLRSLDGIKSILAGAIGMSVADIDGLVTTFFGDLAYEKDGETVNVNSISTLAEYVRINMNFSGKLAFNFNSDKKFVSANASFDYYEEKTPQANYSLNVEKAFVGTMSEPIDAFADFALTADERRENDAVNLLNFSMKGAVTGSSSGKVNRTYTIDVQSDLNPMYLLNLVGNINKENILESKEIILQNLLKLGYFHLEVNETTAGKESNIITIHSNFEDGFAVVQFNIYDISLVKATLALGGVYDFDALIDLIGVLSSAPSEPAPEEPSEGEEEEPLDIMSLLLGILNKVHFDNMAEDGLVLDIQDIFGTVLGVLGLDGLTSTVVSGALSGGSAQLAISLQTPVFGNCKTVSYENIKNNMQGEAYPENKDIFIKKVNGLAEGSEFYFDHNTGSYLVAGDGKDSAYKFTGTDLMNQSKNFYAAIMGVVPKSAPVNGEQEVTIYLAQASEMVQGVEALKGFDLSLDSMLPLMGVMAYETKVKVFDSTQEKVLSVTQFYTSERIDDKLFEITIGDLSHSEKVVVPNIKFFNADNEDVTSSVIATSKLGQTTFQSKAQGTYTMKYMSGIGEVTATVTVGKLVLTYDGTIEKQGDVVDPSKFVLKYEYKDAAGSAKSELVEFDGTKNVYTLGSVREKAIGDVCDLSNGKYTLKKGNLNDKSLTVKTMKITTPMGNTPTASATFTLSFDVTVKKGTTPVSYQSLNGYWTITSDGKAYIVKYDATSGWYAETEDKTPVKLPYAISVDIVRDEDDVAAVLNAKGAITNYLNKDKSGTRSTKFNWKVTVKGVNGTDYFLEDSFSIYELYASDVTLRFYDDTLLDGKILARYLYHEVDGKAVTLEFKYLADADKYALVEKEGTTAVYDVAVSVKDAKGKDFTLTNGCFAGAEAGAKYTVTYTIKIEGTDVKFSHSVTVSEKK